MRTFLRERDAHLDAFPLSKALRGKVMSLLLFSTDFSGPAEEIRAMLELTFHREPLEIYRNIEALSGRLRKPRGALRVGVVILSCQRELMDIVSIGELFRDLSTILILPDENSDTIAKAHLIRPRFLARMDSDPGVIASVLGRLLTSHPKTRKEAAGRGLC
jgi:hypothetical protein